MINHNLEDWLIEVDIPAAGGQPDPGVGGPPVSDPFANSPNIANPAPAQMGGNLPDMGGGEEDDVTQDPQAPDMPEPEQGYEDFEVWKLNYFKESIKSDAQALLDFMSAWREKDDLAPHQRKFIEDNWQIQTLRLNSDISEASKQIRRNIRDQLDRNNPATSVVNHIHQVLDTMPHMNHNFIKMLGYSSMKGELHRKYLAALLGAVQVSSSPNEENIIFNETEYAIKIPTRFGSQWGEMQLGSWSLREDDPERYLSDPELKRLQGGSPEEKDVLRRRVVVESIAKQFEEQAFIIHSVADDGTIYAFGWDLANSLRAAYVEGKLVVRTRHSDNSEAMIDDNGAIVPMIDLNINFVKETGSQLPDGEMEKEEIEFMQRRNGMLFLVAGVQTLRDAAISMQGSEFKEIPWTGNPSDLKVLRHCIFSIHDMLMRRC